MCYKLGEVIVKEESDPARARRYLQRALARANEKPDSPEKVKCLAALVSCLLLERAVQPAFEQAQTALQLAESAGYPGGVATACGALCRVYEAQGDIESYYAMARRQIAALHENGSLYDLFEAFDHMGKAATLAGHYAEAERAALDGLKATEKLHAPGWEIHILAFYGWMLTRQGRWPEMMDWRDRLMPNFQRVGCDPCFGYIFSYLAEVEAKRGEPEKTWKHTQDVITVWTELGRPDFIINARFLAHAGLEEWDAAWVQVEAGRAANSPHMGALPFSLYMTSLKLPEVAGRLGRWSEAMALAQEGLALFGQPEIPAGLAHSHFALGLAHAGQKSWDEALDEYEQALTRFRTLNHRWDIANTQYEMGLVYAARQQTGDLDQGRQLFGEALTTFRDLGASPGTARVEAALERLR